MSWLRGVSEEIWGLLRAHRAAALVFPLLAAVFLGQVLFTGKSLSAFDIIASLPSWTSEFAPPHVHQPILSDSPTAHYPERKVDWSLFKEGQDVNFDPYIFSGVPTLDQGIGGFVTSLPQLFLDVPNAIDWSTWTRLTLAGIFMYLLLVNLGIGKTASILGGVVWTYNLHQVVWLELPEHLAAQLWIPLLLLFNIKAITSGFRRDFVVGLVVTNILFYTSFYTQIVLYTDIAVGVFNTFYIFSDRSSPLKTRAVSWLKIHGIYVTAMLILAVSVFVEASFIKHGLRGAQHWRSGIAHHLTFNFSTIFTFFKDLIPNAAEIKRFMAPNYFGGIWGAYGYHSPDHSNIVEDAAYIGILSLFFVFYSVINGVDKQHRRVFYSFVALLMFFIAFYYQDPVVLRLINLIPLAGLGSYSRAIAIIIFLMSILAAYGVDRFLLHVERRNSARILIVLIVFAITPVAVKLIVGDVALSKFLYFYAIVGLLACISIVFAWRRWVAALGAVMVAVVAADLFAVGINFNTKLPNSEIFKPTTTIRLLMQDRSAYRVAVLADEPFYPPNVLAYFKIASIDGYSTVAPRRYVDFIKKVVGRSDITANGILFVFRADLRALRMMNVKYVISDKPLPGSDLKLLLRNSATYVYQITDSLNRVYCASDYFAGKDISASMGRVKSLFRDYDRPALVVDGPFKDGEKMTADCSIKHLGVYTNSLTFTTHAASKTFAILPYNYSTNWKVKVNGKPAKLFRANYVYMGFEVPTGDSKVEVYYENYLDSITGGIMIVLGLGLVGYGVGVKRGNAAGLLFCFVGALFAWKNIYTIPGIRNDRIPERPVQMVGKATSINTVGIIRSKNVKPSKIIEAGSPYKENFVSPLDGLRGVAVYVATYRQNSLPYDVTVSIRDMKDHKVYKKVFKGSEVHDNSWLMVHFPEVVNSRGKQFEIEVTTPAKDNKHPLVVWLNPAGKVCLSTYHDPKTAYR